MSDEAPVAELTAGSFLSFVEQIDADIPKLKSFLEEVQANPALVQLAVTLFPGIAPLVPVIDKVGPWLDFFQGLADAVTKAMPAAS